MVMHMKDHVYSVHLVSYSNMDNAHVDVLEPIKVISIEYVCVLQDL